jgi:peptidoglycan/LPS O-acetylase OafA/YrhL
LKYRPDIDGLRTVAVLSVVTFHAFPQRVTGGFIGVDIFFVISGYLISTIIFGNLEQGRYSTLDFYSRRVRRIFPALIVVLAASFAFGWFALLAEEFQQLGKHLAAGAGFVSNLVFWNEAGYFDEAADTKPMLHLWSLGIEEQFYIFWPLILWFSWERRINLLVVTLVFVAASFALNVWNVHADAVATFYSPLTRFWELSVGSGLAYVNLYRKELSERLQWGGGHAQSFLGLALIVAGLVATNKNSVFPGWWALLPVSGAALVIAAGAQAWPNRVVLSSRLFVWFGLISFPLYLWHWPLLSFATIVEGEFPPGPVRAAAVVAAIVLAWLTYRLIEMPLRSGGRRKELVLGLCASMAVVAGIGLFTYADGGLKFRAAARPQIARQGEVGFSNFHEYPYTTMPLCTPLSIRAAAPVWEGQIRCLQSKPGEVRNVAIIGDSHAEHLFVGFAEQLPGANVVYYIQNSLPVLSNPRFDRIFATAMADPNIGTVILSAYWTLRMLEVPKGSTLQAELARTTGALVSAGKRVYLSDDVASFSFSPKKCKYESNWIRTHRCSEDSAFFSKRYAEFAPLLDEAARAAGARILHTAGDFCADGKCAMDRGDTLLYRDDNHLNADGSRLVARLVAERYPEIAHLP